MKFVGQITLDLDLNYSGINPSTEEEIKRLTDHFKAMIMERINKANIIPTLSTWDPLNQEFISQSSSDLIKFNFDIELK